MVIGLFRYVDLMILASLELDKGSCLPIPAEGHALPLVLVQAGSTKYWKRPNMCAVADRFRWRIWMHDHPDPDWEV